MPAEHLQRADQLKDLFLTSCLKRFLHVNSKLSVLQTEMTLLLSDNIKIIPFSIQMKSPSRN